MQVYTESVSMGSGAGRMIQVSSHPVSPEFQASQNMLSGFNRSVVNKVSVAEVTVPVSVMSGGDKESVLPVSIIPGEVKSQIVQIL
jgi:hypothetical protein